MTLKEIANSGVIYLHPSEIYTSFHSKAKLIMLGGHLVPFTIYSIKVKYKLKYIW